MKRAWLTTLPAVLALAALPAGARQRFVDIAFAEAPHVVAERSGSVPARGTRLFHLTADAGNVRVLTGAPDEVRYLVRIEAEAGNPEASALLKEFSLTARNTPAGVVLTGNMPASAGHERTWVSYEIYVPSNFNLQISTGAGDVATQDAGGKVEISTGGGEITVGGVAGSLHASTAGGRITTGDVQGDAVLHTGGGHIHAGRIAGAAQFSTGGGNIVVAETRGTVTADTDGGTIEFGEAGGAIHARTSGGGIRIARLHGPTELDSAAGSIVLTDVEAPLHATTAAGTITAWVGAPSGDASSASRDTDSSELVAKHGDIVLYLPRETAITVDAAMQQSSGHAVFADPALPVKVSYSESGGGNVRAVALVNGGGKVLHVRADEGNVVLKSADRSAERRMAEAQMQALQARWQSQSLFMMSQLQNHGAVPAMPGAGTPASSQTPPPPATEADNHFAEMARMFEALWGSEMRVGPDEQDRRLVRPVEPEYPEAARLAGIEGDVTLRVLIGKDGMVSKVTPLGGEPSLIQSAVDAVEQWHYSPALLDGRPVGVVTTVTVAYRLH